MGQDITHSYELDPCVAELYGRQETRTDDIALLRRLIGARRGLCILEPFCGTGRILLPLAADGHRVDGLDRAAPMLERARARLALLPSDVHERVRLMQMDVLAEPWPGRYDLVILGGNCLYELATPEQQLTCIARAAEALGPGGHLFVDSDHMEGELDPAWRDPDVTAAFPSSICDDGTVVASTRETIWHDAPRRLALFRRVVRITRANGGEQQQTFLEQKHPVSYDEVHEWIVACGLAVQATYGDHDMRPYTPDAPRAIFWAQKPQLESTRSSR